MPNTVRDFVSSSTFTEQEVKSILLSKIEEENIIAKTKISDIERFEEKSMLNNLHYETNKVNIVSLFSGAGGLDLGVELAGLVTKYGETYAYNILNNKEQFWKMRKNGLVNFVYSNDLFESANMTYMSNFPKTVTKIAKDIRKVAHFPKANLMLGGFPCPGFSAAGPRLLDDPRNFLYVHYIRALMQSQPEFFIAENVKGLMTMANGRVLKQITEDFSAAGYDVKVHLVNSRDYGVPQLRERVFIIGTRADIKEKYGFEYELPSPTHGVSNGLLPYTNLYDAISDLPYEADDVFQSDYSSMYMSRNRKKRWTEQSFTIQASGRQAPQHPQGEEMKKVGKDSWEFSGTQNRRLSVREVARIQTFPDWFEFSDGNKSNVQRNHLLNEKYKQIGNAVPVILAEKISRPIIKFLTERMIQNS